MHDELEDYGEKEEDLETFFSEEEMKAIKVLTKKRGEDYKNYIKKVNNPFIY
jgi:predicted DNA binding CopG/RHH family protein